jgi:hypothetical protein
MAMAKLLPTTTDPCGDVKFSAKRKYDQGQLIGKVDYQLATNHSLFGRYMVTYDKQLPSYPDSKNTLTTRPEDTNQKHTAHSFTAGDTTVYGSSAVNSLRVAWNRTNSHYNLEPFFGPETIGVKNFYNYVPGVMGMAVTGAFTTASGGSVYFQADTDAYQVSDDVTLVRGPHQLAVGTNLTYGTHLTVDGQRGPGLWTFNGSVTGTGLSDFLTGKLFQLEQARPGVLDLDMWYVGLYGQDTWRVSSRVTLNAGLRWEPFFGQNVRNKAVSNFNIDNFRKGVKSTVYTNAPAGLIYPGDAGFPSGKSGLNNQWLNIAPRAGLAWDVMGDGRMAVRASYGLGYDFQSASYLFISATAPPYSSRIRVNSPIGGFDDPYLGYPGGPPHPVPEKPCGQRAVSGLRRVRRDRSRHQLDPRAVVECDCRAPDRHGLAGVGELSRKLRRSHLGAGGAQPWHLPRARSLHVAKRRDVSGVHHRRELDQRRTLSLENPTASQLLGPIDQHAAVGTQNYHAMRLSMQRRATSGVRLSANYTRSYCVGNAIQTTFGQVGSGFLKPDDPAFDRGNCSQDRTHIANLTTGFQTPEFSNAALRVIASD